MTSINCHNKVLIVSPAAGEDASLRVAAQPKQVKKMSFFRKFAELQLLMLQHNAGLTASHPYASGPINWPFLLNGISFWTGNEEQQQIYLAGNVVGWWMCVMALSIFLGIVGADLVARRRDVKPIPEGAMCSTSRFWVLSNVFHRGSQSLAQLDWVLCFRLGIPLFPLLFDEPTVIRTSLSPCTPGLDIGCWIGVKLYSH